LQARKIFYFSLAVVIPAYRLGAAAAIFSQKKL
jgi:hypothetical protein